MRAQDGDRTNCFFSVESTHHLRCAEHGGDPEVLEERFGALSAILVRVQRRLRYQHRVIFGGHVKVVASVYMCPNLSIKKVIMQCVVAPPVV